MTRATSDSVTAHTPHAPTRQRDVRRGASDTEREQSQHRLGKRTQEIADMLDVTYGPRPWRPHLSPIDELIATILSQHTSDTNTERAFASLRGRFPTWLSVIEAPTRDVAGAIRTGGLADQKAPRIQAVLSTILRERGSFDLDFLALMPIVEARAWLTAIHGIGPKTASCVLLFSLGMAAIPVDTHVHRVARRIGLIPNNLSADRAHDVLERQLNGDRDRAYAFHMHLIGHGRTICAARGPHCDRCALNDRCDFAKSN